MVMSPHTARSIVLVVEDEPLIRACLIEAFQDAGFSVLDTADGDHAVRILEENAHRIFVVFSDVNLPGSMNGVLLAKHARAHWPWVDLVLASGRPKPENTAMPLGARFFQKPYAIASVVAHVRELTN
jgi:DNA-binding response OmpR family regulator